MSKAEIVILCGAIFQGLCIFLGNFITVFVFWMHRHKLKRTSFLLINLSVTDLLVGLTQIAMVGAIAFPRTTGVRKVSNKYSPDISTCFQAAFSTASVFFLALISLERAFALMWPLRASYKHQYLHLQHYTRMDSCNDSWCIVFVSCVRYPEIQILHGSLVHCHYFKFGYSLPLLFSNSNKTHTSRPGYQYWT